MAYRLDSGTRYVLFGAGWVTAGAIPIGYLLYLAGSLAFHAGMTINRPLGGGVVGRPFPVGGYAALWGVGALGAFGLLKELGGTISGSLSWAPMAALSAYALRDTKKRSGLGFWLTMVGGTAVLFLIGLESGSKNVTMMALFPVFWVLVVSRGLRLWVVPLGIVATVIYVMVVVPVISWSRQSLGARPDNQAIVLLQSWWGGEATGFQGEGGRRHHRRHPFSHFRPSGSSLLRR